MLISVICDTIFFPFLYFIFHLNVKQKKSKKKSEKTTKTPNILLDICLVLPMYKKKSKTFVCTIQSQMFCFSYMAISEVSYIFPHFWIECSWFWIVKTQILLVMANRPPDEGSVDIP